MKRWLAALCAAAMLFGAAQVQAQEKYPNRPVRVVTAFAPGSATDIIARLLAERLRVDLGQNFLVENKPGAFGIVAIEEMARAKPDGYTVMVGNISTTVLTPLLYRKKFSINPDKDVTVVSRIGILPNLFITTVKDFPPKTMAEFVAYAKQRPGKILYATNAIGSFPHFDSEILARRAGIEMVHVPVKGGPPDFMKDMITGDVHAAFVNAASSAAFVRGGQLRALAAVSEQRLAEFPDVPTMAEVGFPGVGTQLWSAMTAPAGTPRELLETLNAAVTKALNSDTLKEAYKKQSVIPAPTPSLAATQEWLKAEVAKWNGIINEVKIEIPE